ncbi:uncharacterized protein LOC142011584 [Carettochelys insculpta]|uniref:uncharacterized protein LOC142011584 n=1 Tax=Carettochelys insculpta TaxID=44489 RepID=UPI003EB774F2
MRELRSLLATLLRLLQEPSMSSKGPDPPLPLPGPRQPISHVWTHAASSDWWDRVVMAQWDNKRWQRNLHMQKGTFHEICTWLAPVLHCQDTGTRPDLLVEKRLVFALWKLANLDSYCFVGQQFGVGKSTFGTVILEVVRAINNVLVQRLVYLRDLGAAMASFTELRFPQCFGAVDGTHIPSGPRPAVPANTSTARDTA